jgi:hypothetical protein
VVGLLYLYAKGPEADTWFDSDEGKTVSNECFGLYNGVLSLENFTERKALMRTVKK